MASRALMLYVLQAMFVTLALSGFMKNVSGEEMTTGEVVPEQQASKSSFVRRQLVENPQQGKGLFFGVCPFNCALTPLIPTCCTSFLGIGLCKNLLIDPLNCGACNTICPLGTICCFGKCVNTLTDANNCGICGKVCRFPGKCSFGLCNYNGKLIL